MAAIEIGLVTKPFIVLLFLGLGIGLGLSTAFLAPEPDADQTIEWLDNPRYLSPFTLESEAGQFDNQSLMGQWTIVIFGFLNCPDFCPTSLSQLASIADGLVEKSVDQ